MVLECPKCSAQFSAWSLKNPFFRKAPFPCPTCGTKIKAEIPKGSVFAGVVIWSVLEIPLFALDNRYGGLGVVIRIVVSAFIGMFIAAMMFKSKGIISLAPNDDQPLENL